MSAHSSMQTSPRAGLPRRFIATLVSAALAGCGTVAPLPPWNESKVAAAATLPAAIGELRTLRNAYRDAVRSEFRLEHHSANALLGVGALVAALAASHVHRDAVFGASFLAGTGYLYANRNVSRPRMLAYLAGIDALNCTERAVGPLAMSAVELESLSTEIGKLDVRLLALRQSIETVRKLLAEQTAKQKLSEWQAAKAATDAAEATHAAASTTLTAAQKLASATRRAPLQLTSAIRGIDAAVMRSVIQSTPDLSSVPALVGGLAGAVGAFAPGAGFEGAFTDALKAFSKTPGLPGMSTDSQLQPLVDAAKAMIDEADAVRQSQLALERLMAGRSDPWPADAFKDCGVAQVVSPLSVSETTVTFQTQVGARRLVDINGGVKPYFVELNGQIEGLTLRPPYRYESRAVLEADGAKLKPGRTQLRITDSASTANSASIDIVVNEATAAPAAPTAPAASAAPAPSAALPEPSQARIVLKQWADKGSVDVDGSTLTVVPNTLKTAGMNWSLTLRCKAGIARTETALRQAVMKDAKLAGLPTGVALSIATDPASCKTGN